MYTMMIVLDIRRLEAVDRKPWAEVSSQSVLSRKAYLESNTLKRPESIINITVMQEVIQSPKNEVVTFKIV